MGSLPVERTTQVVSPYRIVEFKEQNQKREIVEILTSNGMDASVKWGSGFQKIKTSRGLPK
jgi:hypothetical protein